MVLKFAGLEDGYDVLPQLGVLAFHEQEHSGISPRGINWFRCSQLRRPVGQKFDVLALSLSSGFHEGHFLLVASVEEIGRDDDTCQAEGGQENDQRPEASAELPNEIHLSRGSQLLLDLPLLRVLFLKCHRSEELWRFPFQDVHVTIAEHL